VTRVAIVLSVLAIALATDVAARGGRGGGGGRGFARGGVAAGGSFGQRAPMRGGAHNRYDRQGPVASGTFAGRSSDRVDRRQERRDDRRGGRDEAREDWQEHADERREDWQSYGAGGAYYYDYGYGGEPYYAEEEVVVDGDGAETPVEMPPSWTLDCEPNVIILGTTTYYQCGSAWYVRVYRGGDIAYTMVNPPAGY